MAEIRRKRLRGAPVQTTAQPTTTTSQDAHTHYCYALTLAAAAARKGAGRTYVGYTVDPARRLRQHNGVISGGAAATSRSGANAWRFMFVVAVEDEGAGGARFGSHEGLSLEWHLKNGRCRRKRGATSGNPVANRIARLAEALALPKFAAFTSRFVVFVAADLVDDVWASLLDQLAFACCVLPLDDLFA